MDDTYLTFLQLLDDSQLITHIKSLSQDAELFTKPGSRVASRSASLIGTSTPSKVHSTIVKSFESDPFDDDLDSELLNLAVREPSALSLGEIPCNQLAIAEHEDTSTDEETEMDAKHPGGSFIHSSGISSNAKPTSVENLTTTRTEALVVPDAPNTPQEENEASENEENENAFGDVGPIHKFGEYDAYFRNKFLKQQAADQAYVEWDIKRRKALGESAEPSKIFQGCRVYVNGNTVPTLGVIHKLVIIHGGRFLNYLQNKGAATHIVCDKLTPRKRIEFRNYKVVKAKWIADCVDQNKLLDWREYRLINEVDFDQQRLGFDNLGTVEQLNVIDKSEISDDKTNLSDGPVDHDNPEDSGDDLDAFDDLQVDFENGLEDYLEDFGDNIDGVERDLGNDLETELETNQEQEPEIHSERPSGNDDFPNSNNLLEKNTELLDHSSTTIETDGVPENMSGGNQMILQLNAAQGQSHHGAMDAKHPDFLKHFFANSRLHHLSMWKADLRSKFLRLVMSKSQQSQPKETAGKEKVILHVDFDCFFATASALSHPELDIHKDPIAVSHGGNSSDVASCNYVARAKGVSNGMWLGRAKSLCPQLRIVDYDFNKYEQCSTAFYNYLISKDIFDSIFPVLIDEVLVDATSFCRQDKESQEAVSDLCKQIRKDIFDLTGCSVSIGASSNVLLAKLAIKKAKPDGFFYLHDTIETFLDQTKIRDIPGIGRSLELRLSEELHIPAVFVRDVKQMTLTKLSTVFGEKTGLKLFQNCRGIDPTDIALDLTTSDALLGRKSVSVDINWGIRFDTHEQAEVFLMSLAKEIHSRLIDLGVCGSSMTLRIARRSPGSPVNPPKFLGMGRCDFFSKSTRLGVPTNDWGIIGSEMKSIFRILNIPAKELRGMAVSMTKLEDVNAVKKNRQQTLRFDRKSVKKPPKIDSQVPYAEPVTNSESVDWEVFNLLPDDIQKELKQELRRRGIPVAGREKGAATSFSKDGRKVYIQQMFPSQANGPFKHSRVVESPKKKRKLQVSPVKSVLPVKREPSPTVFNKTISYDEDVLKEIPSSIRDDFFQDLEWQRKSKRLVFVPMKEKLRGLDKNRQAIVESEITLLWIAEQPTISKLPTFAGISSFSELLTQLRQWVKLSVDDHGPHSDDVGLFVRYIDELARKRKISRSVALVNVIGDEIRLQRTIALISSSPLDRNKKLLGISDWKVHYEKMKKMILSICKEFGITVEFV